MWSWWTTCTASTSLSVSVSVSGSTATGDGVSTLRLFLQNKWIHRKLWSTLSYDDVNQDLWDSDLYKLTPTLFYQPQDPQIEIISPCCRGRELGHLDSVYLHWWNGNCRSGLVILLPVCQLFCKPNLTVCSTTSTSRLRPSFFLSHLHLCSHSYTGYYYLCHMCMSVL